LGRPSDAQFKNYAPITPDKTKTAKDNLRTYNFTFFKISHKYVIRVLEIKAYICGNTPTFVIIGAIMIKVVIFEDNKHLRNSLSLVINNTEGMACSGAFPNGNNLIRDIVNGNPDLVLMDIDMPGMDGIECTKVLKNQFPHIKILMQTVFEDNEKIYEAIKAGANGYILKKARPQELIDAIRDAAMEGAPMSPEVARKVLALLKSSGPEPSTRGLDLTPREKEILQLLVDGHSYKSIAELLFISFSTVQSHIKKIYEKMEVNSKSEAVSKAYRNKLL